MIKISFSQTVWDACVQSEWDSGCFISSQTVSALRSAVFACLHVPAGFIALKWKLTDCTLRITSRSREVILPLCLAPVRHISSAGSSCGLPSTRWGHPGPAKAMALGLQPHTGGGGGRKRRRRILCCLQFPNGVRTRQCQPLQGCPEKVQESGGKCQECVGKMFLEGLVWQQGSRGAVKLLPWQILINWLD